jgi:hypothetical protein
MSNKEINPKVLLNLLLRFLDKDTDLPDNIIIVSGEFLFKSSRHPDLDQYPVLLRTLEYLKKIRERNQLKDLNDLVAYYDKKRERVTDLFNKLEETGPEERIALSFQKACTTYMRIVRIEQISKAESFYYPMTSGCNVAVSFENISYRDTLEEEIEHLSRVKGNHLLHQKNISCVSEEKIKLINSN